MGWQEKSYHFPGAVYHLQHPLLGIRVDMSGWNRRERQMAAQDSYVTSHQLHSTEPKTRDLSLWRRKQIIVVTCNATPCGLVKSNGLHGVASSGSSKSSQLQFCSKCVVCEDSLFWGEEQKGGHIHQYGVSHKLGHHLSLIESWLRYTTVNIGLCEMCRVHWPAQTCPSVYSTLCML
jgi:hypothetical protein